ncbi:MAG TPA: energy transducer TonB [Terriglobales bacterium]
MFSTLESTWDRSVRRGWTTLASFGFQAMALSLLLLLPLIWIQGPPKLQWFTSLPVPAPPLAPAPPASGQRPTHGSNVSGTHVMQPPAIPPTIAILNEQSVASAPNIDEGGVPGGTGKSRRGVFNSIGPTVEVAPPPPPPPPTHPLRVSHWSEGNLIYRVQPIYPPLARQARIQGPVELRAIISRAGTIENLVVLRGHPMLVPAAIDAVRQWRYRPYLLNGEPIEVEFEITVNFILGGS